MFSLVKKMNLANADTKKKRFIIKKPKSLKKTKTLSKKPKINAKNKTLNEEYLEFDVDINPKFMESIDTETKINFNNINALPKLHFEKNINENEIEDDFEEFIVNTSDETENDIDKDIDKDSLEMVVIGNKKYLMDYNKGFIYDTKFNIVGNIDEFGNPNIN
jgi:hypothetical protein